MSCWRSNYYYYEQEDCKGKLFKKHKILMTLIWLILHWLWRYACMFIYIYIYTCIKDVSCMTDFIKKKKIIWTSICCKELLRLSGCFGSRPELVYDICMYHDTTPSNTLNSEVLLNDRIVINSIKYSVSCLEILCSLLS